MAGQLLRATIYNDTLCNKLQSLNHPSSSRLPFLYRRNACRILLTYLPHNLHSFPIEYSNLLSGQTTYSHPLVSQASNSEVATNNSLSAFIFISFLILSCHPRPLINSLQIGASRASLLPPTLVLTPHFLHTSSYNMIFTPKM